jgi:hypothetical protein
MRGTGNKYVYADNNPLSKVDIYGMYTVSIEGIDTSVNGTLDAVAYSIAESHPPFAVQVGSQATTHSSGNDSSSSSTQTASGQQQAQAQAAQAQGQQVLEAQNTINTNPPTPGGPPFLIPNAIFTTVDAASAASARADQQAQQATGAENGSVVFSFGGVYTFSDPVTQGQKTTVDPFNTSGTPQAKTVDLSKAPIPPGTDLAAETHSHPTDSGFSGEDIQRAHDLTIPAFGHPNFKGEYVGLPSGSVIKYDPITGRMSTFAPGQP